MGLLLLMLLSSLCSGAGQILLRIGSRSLGSLTVGSFAQPTTWQALLLNPAIVGGVACWGLATLVWIVVLNRTQLSYAYYVASLNYILLPLVDRFLFSEQIHPVRLAGMAVILVGIVITIYGRSLQP
jgi:drug/metabolite transporter (DMT)-like permease